MKFIKIFFSFAFALALISSCNRGSANETSPKEPLNAHGEKIVALTLEQFNTSGMKLGRLTPQLFSERVHATGMLDVPPQYKTAVSAYYGGTVKEVHLLVGQKVSQGATLFTLENPEYVQMQQDYLSAKSRLNYLRAEYERQKTLLNEKVASRKKFLKAEADYLSVLSDYNALGKKLELLNIDTQTLNAENITTFAEIKAPISGYVTEVNITRGQYLSPNEVAVSIVSNEHMHLELNVFEKDITKIRKGQPIRFRLPDNGTDYYEGEVFLVGRAVYSEDRAINVHGHFHPAKQNFPFIPGMYIEAEILVDQQQSPALPADAVVNVGEANYVLVKKSLANNTYTFAQRAVKIGRTNDGYIQILNADELANQEILIKGAFDLIQ